MKNHPPFPENTNRTPKTATPAWMVMGLSGLMGGVSMIFFGLFLFMGLPGGVDLGLGEAGKLYFNTLLCLLFFIQHSLMLRKKVRSRISEWIPPDYLGACYAIFSGVFLFLLMFFWQKSTGFRIALSGSAWWMMRILFGLSAAGFLFTARSLRSFDPLGIRELFSNLQGRSVPPPVLTVDGAYRWVRHPFYFLSLLMIWSAVTFTADRLLFNGLWTCWIVIGAFLEERDLAEAFGEPYRQYRQTVPMLIPFRRPSRR